MKAINVAVISLCVLITCYVDCAAHSLRRSQLVKKDKFSITGEANTHGTKTELNIHVESVDEKSPATTSTNAQKGVPPQPANQKEAAANTGRNKATQTNSKRPNKSPGQTSQSGLTPTILITNTAGKVGTKQVTSPPPSKATPSAPPSGPGQGKALEVTPKPNKNNGPTQTSSTPGQQNQPTSQVTNAASTTQVTSSPKMPISQQPSGVTPTQNPSTPGQQNKATGKVTNGAGMPTQNKVNPSPKNPISQKPSRRPEPGSESGVSTKSPTPSAKPSGQGTALQVTSKPSKSTGLTSQSGITPTQNPSTNGQQNKPKTNAAGTNQVTSSPKKPISQENKPSGKLTNTASPNQATPSPKNPTRQQPSKIPGPTSQSGLTPTQIPSTTGQQNKPTRPLANVVGKVGTNQVTLPPPSKASSSAKPSGQGQGKPFQVTPKPSKSSGPTTQSGVKPTQIPSTPGQQNKPTENIANTAGKPVPNKVNPTQKKPVSQNPSTFPGPTSQSGLTPTKNPSTPGQQNKPTGKVTNRASKPSLSKINPSQKKPVSQHSHKIPGPTPQSGVTLTRNPSTPEKQNKPTGKVTNRASKPSLSKINPSQKTPVSQHSHKIPGPTPQSGVTPTQNPSTPGQQNKPIIATISGSKATPTAQSSSPGKAFQVTPKPKFEFSEAEKMALSAHNAFRKTHQSKPMKLTEDLVSAAREMAEKLASEGDLIHQTSDVLNKINQGESLAKICSQKNLFKPHSIIKHVVDAWYAEVCRYNFQDPNPASKETAHFTQLVWNASNELGIGVAQKEVNDQYCWFIVARYRPQGNINDKEEFNRNVKKGSFDPLLNNCVDSSDQI